eukprot:Hpha_TRINITY_DN16626_c1_g1::TRINITY_DN16626_c1_g1_i1::g.178298::m.178298
MMEILLYLRCEEGKVCAVEVDAMGVVEDILAAARATLGSKVSGVSFGGKALDPSAKIADTGVGSESTLDILMRRHTKWEQGAANVKISDDKTQAKLDGESTAAFSVVLGTPIPPGENWSCRMRWSQTSGAIRSCGLTAEPDVVEHDNHDTYTPPKAVCFSACGSSRVLNELTKSRVQEEADVHLSATWTILFELIGRTLTITVGDKKIATVENLPSKTLYPFANFYSGNQGDTVELPDGVPGAD